MTKEDVLEALGVEMTEDRFMTGLLVGVGIGALVGGVVALLLTPKSGSEMRQTLSDRGREMKDRLRARYEQASSEVAGVPPSEPRT